MPRVMPGFCQKLSSKLQEARDLVEAVEVIRFHPEATTDIRSRLHHQRLELIYELAYLRAFTQWENFLEDVFLRFLAGYTHAGVPILANGPRVYTLSAAQSKLYGGKTYLLWHNPDHVINRANQHFATAPFAPVISSDLARLRCFAAIRHRIAHASVDACAKFDVASIGLTGRRFGGSKAGALLRSIHTTGPHPVRWIEVILTEIEHLSVQILP